MIKEKVLVFNKEEMKGFKNLPGVTKNKNDIDYFTFEVAGISFYLTRDKAEDRPQYKQIIPYTVIRHQDKILVYKRTKKGGEGRLHDKYSIGVGGHINPEDGHGTMAISNAISREVLEEIKMFDDTFLIKQVGLIYDDSNSVGKVHFGVVFEMTLPDKIDKLPVPAEDSLAEFQWLTPGETKKIKTLENWSKMALEIL